MGERLKLISFLTSPRVSMPERKDITLERCEGGRGGTRLELWDDLDSTGAGADDCDYLSVKFIFIFPVCSVE